MTSEHTISDLRTVPGFADVVADRIWRAWWQEDGVPFAGLRSRLDESFGTSPIPSAFVAHRHGLYLGSILLIENDLPERPALRPWVAALWVEPGHRRSQRMPPTLPSGAGMRAPTSARARRTRPII